MTVSLCIIAYNEERSLPRLLEQVTAQSFPHEQTELVFVDSCSEDGTKQLFESFADEHKDEYIAVQVLDNPKKNQAAGWNTAIKAAVGDVIIRVDAHAEIPDDFIESNMKLIESGEDVCGGARPSIVDDPTPVREMLFLAESSMFGSSAAGYRRKSGEKKYVNSVFHGAYRREVFEKVGGFNEDLGRTEDNELHYRIRQAGYKICQGSDIVSYQHIRASLSSMLSQKYANGKWIGLTLGVCYQCLSSFHLVPFYFVFMLICFLMLFVSGFITGHFWMLIPFLILMGAYIFAALVMTAAAIIKAEKKHPLQLLLPAVFFLLHISYGWGTIVGIVKMPFWKSKLGSSAKEEIENVRECVRNNTINRSSEVVE